MWTVEYKYVKYKRELLNIKMLTVKHNINMNRSI